MTTTDFKNVDEYIAAQSESGQAVLRVVRRAIRRALPKAEEVISYKIPAYALHGAVIIYFAGWKRHYSLYPAGDSLVAAFQDELTPYKISKGTIRLPLGRPVPVKLIERIAKFRAAEVAKRDRGTKSPNGR